MSGRLIIEGPCGPIENMSRDEALLHSCDNGGAGFPVLRFYKWSVPTLSLGSKERLNEAADVDTCKAKGIEIVRRITGGRAVLHHEELTYSIIARLDQPPFNGSIIDSYHSTAEAIRKAILKIGIELDLTSGNRRIAPRTNNSGVIDESGRQNRLHHKPCFAAPSRYELAYQGKKVVGSAQRRVRNAVLQHGSILFKSNVDLLALATGVDELNKEILSRSMTGLEEISSGDISVDELISHLAESLEKVFNTSLIVSTLTEKEHYMLTDLRTKISARLSP